MKSKKAMRVNLFQVEASEGSDPLHDLLKQIEKTRLENRVRDLGYKLRLEILLAPDKTNPYWLLDFSKLRYDGGPGRATSATLTTSFDLGAQEGFSEETAMLYDPATRFALIQYNHHGPRVGVIEEYLSIFDPNNPAGYAFKLQLKGDAQARLGRKKVFTRIEFKVAPARLTPHYRNKHVSMTSMLESQVNKFGGDFVSVTVGLDQRSPKSLNLKDWLNPFKALANEEDATTVLKITGRDHAGGKIDPVDLIEEKEQQSFTGLQLDDGLRYVRADRWKRLESAFSSWKSRGVIA